MGEITFKTITLDSTLDDIDDLPAFVVPQKGAYHCRITLVDRMSDQKDWVGAKEGEKHPAVELKAVIVECSEVPEIPTGEVACKPGDTFNLVFMMDNEFGAGKFKFVAGKISEKLATKNMGQIIAQTKDMEVLLVMDRRKDKKDADKIYPDIKNCIPL